MSSDPPKPGTPEYVRPMIEDFCLAVAMARTATGDAGVAMDLSSAIKLGMWLLGGYGALDWEHHRILETTDTPRELLVKLKALIRGHFKNLPVLTERVVINGFWFDLDDPDLIRGDAEKAFRKISRRITKNERDGFDPKSNRGFDIPF